MHLFQQIGGAVGIALLNGMSTVLALVGASSTVRSTRLFTATAFVYVLALAATWVGFRGGKQVSRGTADDERVCREDTSGA